VPMSVDEARTALDAFLKSHPYSKVEEVKEPRPCVALIAPWGDQSILLDLTDPDPSLLEGLNDVLLPERFSAIYHKKDKKFEVIFTSYPVPTETSERSFDFVHNGALHKCSFSKSSDVLLSIAKAFSHAEAATSTGFRNLTSFQYYVFRDRLPKGFPVNLGEPISFWIEPVDYEDDAMLGLANHLNFFMSYYDTMSPNILIHSPGAENIKYQPQTRFALDTFPKKIVSRQLDDVLIHFWYAAKIGDPARRFLYNYQILEYSSYYFIEDEIRRQLHKALAAPHALNDLTGTTEELLDIVGQGKIYEGQKMDAAIKKMVDPKLIWREIESNKTAFCEKTSFEGGFELSPIVGKPNWTVDDFRAQGISSFVNSIRQIRNALSHGKEHRMSTVITPTKSNFEKLQAWVPLVSVAACEVMIYRGLM
jgi:hypothetical protein